MTHSTSLVSRRTFLAGATAAMMGGVAALARLNDQNEKKKKAQIAITFDLEMSRMYPTRDQLEWDYQKGNLDTDTKNYSVQAAQVASDLGGVIHYFCVGRVLEQPNIDWLKEIAALGHPIGNHTYDHVNVHAKAPEKIQFRFQRAPWLIEGEPVEMVIRDNVAVTTTAMFERANIVADGFRTPGGFNNGIKDRPDLQEMFIDLGFSWISSLYPSHKYGVPKEEPTPDVYDSIVESQMASQPFVYPNGLIEIPMSAISDVGAFRSNYWKLEWFLKAVRLAVEHAIETGGVYDFLCHPSCMLVEDPGFETVKLICQLVKDAGDKAEIVGLSKIAERVKEAT
ncbi:MAG: polysaccharide deacetylase family protein [Planctomycetota bacterium]|nr:polysaccharide deacetylase family protein [Planctomycetota bacterium]MDA1211882.1 polysaccharide deacetylase family protein [Planctomycetota bacterium]